MIPVTQNPDGSLTFRLDQQALGPITNDANSITIAGSFALPLNVSEAWLAGVLEQVKQVNILMTDLQIKLNGWRGGSGDLAAMPATLVGRDGRQRTPFDPYDVATSVGNEVHPKATPTEV